MKKNINLEDFANGALAERFNIALKEVLENLKDPNTDYKKKRKLTMELVLSTNEAREITSVDIVAKTKLCPAKPITTSLLMDMNFDGEVIASEYKKQIQGQVTMTVDSETGEIKSTEDNRVDDLEGLKIVK